MEVMTNQEAKHKAIQEAYGEYWEQLSQEAKTIALRNDGWVFWKDFPKGISETESDANTFYRPKSLSGIEDNNGFIRIEPDGSNLPTDDKKYTVGKYEEGNFIKSTDYFKSEELAEYHTSMQITHYRPVEEIPNPIY